MFVFEPKILNFIFSADRFTDILIFSFFILDRPYTLYLCINVYVPSITDKVTWLFFGYIFIQNIDIRYIRSFIVFSLLYIGILLMFFFLMVTTKKSLRENFCLRKSTLPSLPILKLIPKWEKENLIQEDSDRTTAKKKSSTYTHIIFLF